MPDISVIITTKNSGKTLDALLVSLDKQSMHNFEVIVIDNNSTDNTIRIARMYTKNVFDKGPERSAQRNYGASKASGNYLLFLDSDMTLSENVLLKCKKLFENKRDLGGIIIPEKSFGANYWAKCKAFEREINEGQAYFEAARFFSKKIFNQYDGYSTNITGPEDWDLPKRISKKYKIERISNYIYHNEGSPTPWKLMKRKYYYGLTAHEYLKKNNEPAISAQTVYFLRPAFYLQWKKLLRNPGLTLGMVTLLVFETIGGGYGYIRGRFGI